MDFAKMRGELEAAVGGDDEKLGDLAFDMRSLLKSRLTHALDQEDRIRRIEDDWSLDWTWMKPWLDYFEQAIQEGREEQLADWLADGAPGQHIVLPDCQTAAAS